MYYATQSKKLEHMADPEAYHGNTSAYWDHISAVQLMKEEHPSSVNHLDATVTTDYSI